MDTKEAVKRLQADLKRVSQNPPVGITVDIQDEGNIFKWNAMIYGPFDTPFEGGCFRLKMEFPPDYPRSPPSVYFFSRMFHPNVYSSGHICLDILQDMSVWKPAYDAGIILCAIQDMLGEPNPDSPANGIANNLYENDNAAYEEKVKEIVSMSQNEQETDKNLNENED
ncbi:Ubiquitin-conjugating enzyme E2 B [Orchesella cincta]|uniref:Ubiquitin-conjugating enzyme E2 B n=1 Tax=Orchesella cincta TaxID=48709 RepID=A0A1D2MJH3_ORCCI|nr:Ubiquitin-conjugating enzyme E2 B [Orchesella cincta]